jgi:XTP/dITP diphosphohydrolase
MKIVLATSNKGKVKEIQQWLERLNSKVFWEVIAYDQLCTPFEIDETGSTFQENAYIKAKAVFEALKGEHIVLADDSGISVECLDGAPGIYSARYAKIGANDKENLSKLIQEMKIKGCERSRAYYTAAIAVVHPQGMFCVHGWMHGEVVTTPRGENGFGYDPLFIPEGYTQTLGELDDETKHTLSHRAQALNLCAHLMGEITWQK